jgi:phospholipid-binding lipoprotein MlaA
LGLFDVATCAGLPKHHQDFGLTLARYGFVNSTYLMLPFFGPSTIRDSIGWTVDWRYLSPWPCFEPGSFRYSLYGVRLVHKRAALLPADKLIDDAIDPYLFVRDAYLQKRESDIKSICPPCDTPETDSTQKGVDGDDTFVAESDTAEKQSAKDPNDTFVAETDTPSSKGVTTDKGKKQAPSVSGDPFVAP